MTRPFFLKTMLFFVLTAFTSGCVVLVAGGVGAVGGYALSRDTFEGVSAKGQDEIWDAATKVTSIMGTISESKRKNGEIFANINGVNVVVTIIQVNLTTTRLRVKARKGIFPRIAVAQDVYTKVMNQLEE